MRVLFVITRGDEIGGAQSYVRNLIARMAADGHDVSIMPLSTRVRTADQKLEGYRRRAERAVATSA